MVVALIWTHHTQSVRPAEFAPRSSSAANNMETLWLCFKFQTVSFVHRTFKSDSSPKTLILLKEKDWSIGPSFFSTLSPNIMHILFPLSTHFLHLCIPLYRPFLFLLRNDSFHLCLCFHSLPKKSFLSKAPEYTDGFFMSLIHWNKNVMLLPLKISGQGSLTSSF